MKKKQTTLRWIAALAALSTISLTTTHAQTSDADRVADLEQRLLKLEEAQADAKSMHAYWRNGLQFENADRSVRFNIGGRVQSDWAWMSPEESLDEEKGPFRDGTKFRRARLKVSGTLYDTGIFVAEYDFVGGDPIFRDVWAGVKGIPILGTVRVGRMLEPYALEQLSGNNFHQFIERGLPAAFFPFRNNGVIVQNHILNQRMTWAVGAFRHTDAFGDSSTNSKHSVTARFTAAPVYSEDGKTWVHLGASLSQRTPNDDTYRVSSRPESYVAPVMASTGALPTDQVNLAGAEFAATHGPLSVQAEWHMANLDLLESEDYEKTNDIELSGYYLYASYFLTGEHRTYSRTSGLFGRTSPKNNFKSDGSGWGAWEVTARYSELDLNDGPVEGGRMSGITAGINWYLNPNMRAMANYIYSDLDTVGAVDLVTMRFQFDF
jgi:phosphate-selective porin OprO and OprP